MIFKPALLLNPDPAVHYSLPTFVVLLRFPLDSSVSSILQLPGNLLRIIPDEDDFSPPTRCTTVFSHVALDLPIDWSSITVVSEIQALLVTQIIHIVNFSSDVMDLHVVLGRVKFSPN